MVDAMRCLEAYSFKRRNPGLQDELFEDKMKLGSNRMHLAYTFHFPHFQNCQILFSSPCRLPLLLLLLPTRHQ